MKMLKKDKRNSVRAGDTDWGLVSHKFGLRKKSEGSRLTGGRHSDTGTGLQLKHWGISKFKDQVEEQKPLPETEREQCSGTHMRTKSQEEVGKNLPWR